MRSARFALLLFVFACSLPLRGEEILFAGYNLKNYQEKTAEPGMAIKPEREIAALVETVQQIHPDILGVCEMGDQASFDAFRNRLAKAGLDYKDSEWVAGEDPERHLALLSRFPIVERHSRVDASYDLNGERHRVLRGFLDITVEVNPSYRLRLVGVHLKSRRPVAEGEAIIRRNESHLLRQYLGEIIASEPKTNLLCYGDFNDLKNEPTIQEVMGRRGAADEMKDLWLRDPLGDRWTYYNAASDSYDRIDYLFVNRALWPEVNREKCMVYRTVNWNHASDHRPVVATIDAVNR